MNIQLILSSPTTDKRVMLEIYHACEKIYSLPYDVSIQSAPKLKLKIAAPEVIPVPEVQPKVEDAEQMDVDVVISEGALESANDNGMQIDSHGTALIKDEPFDCEIHNKTGVYILNKLKEHPSAAPFLVPVDEATAPNYSKIVKHPMDIGTIMDRMRSGYYGSLLAQFLVDIRQVFKNCYMYNLEESAIYQHAKKLEYYFEKELLPEAVPEMAAVMPAKQEALEAKCPVIPIVIPKLTKLIIPKKKDPPPLNLDDWTVADAQACKRILNKLFTSKEGIWFQYAVIFILLSLG